MSNGTFNFNAFIKESKDILINPKSYFSAMKTTGGMTEPLIKAVIYGAIAGVFALLWSLLKPGAVKGGTFLDSVGVMAMVWYLIFAIIGLFIGTVILLIISSNCKANTDFEANIRVTAAVMIVIPINAFLGLTGHFNVYLGVILKLVVNIFAVWLLYNGLIEALKPTPEATKTKKGKRIAIVLIVLLSLFSGGRWGCSSTSLPPALTDIQRQIIDTTRFKVSVGVEVYHFPVYSEKLIQSLKATSLFARVDKIDNFSIPPTFIARVARTIYGTATIPILTGFSFGLIPTTVQEEHGHAFWLIPYQNRQDSVLIDFSYTGPSTLGWACIYLNFKSDRASGDVYTHQQFYDGFAYAIASNASKIRQFYLRSQ